MTQTITAMYDDKAAAESAMDRLVAAGIPKGSVRLVPGNTAATTSSTSAYDHKRDEGGFWGSLKDAFMPDEDRYTYTEGLSRGGTMLSATVEETQVQTALDIMDDHGSIDLDEREATWRKEGWAGYSATSSTASGGTAQAGTSGAVAARGTAQDSAETIPVVEERLNVGKRVAEQGRVRVRSYAVETPVQEQVSLRDETVTIDRRPVDRAPTPSDEALFAEKTIEATERREQAVVSKDARVVEEIGIRKDSTERTETVSDTVRRTQVEVEDERGNVSRTGTTGAEAGSGSGKPR